MNQSPCQLVLGDKSDLEFKADFDSRADFNQLHKISSFKKFVVELPHQLPDEMSMRAIDLGPKLLSA